MQNPRSTRVLRHAEAAYDYRHFIRTASAQKQNAPAKMQVNITKNVELRTTNRTNREAGTRGPER